MNGEIRTKMVEWLNKQTEVLAANVIDDDCIGVEMQDGSRFLLNVEDV